ncbi:MAG: phenylalanine--tRNA ligase beta subunit-related protein [Patescibacteria group bacterium]
MLFLKSWLEDYINLSGKDLKNLADSISIRSSEVEEVKLIEDYYNDLVLVGRVENIQQHPEIESLKYFNVNLGSKGFTQIVSKANNVQENMVVPVALPGANFAGFVVGAKKMKGVDSNGVCLGKSELNLETPYSEGLWDITEEVKENQLGLSICKVFPELFPKDTIFDIKILPDKISKIGNHLGMAIEIATVLKDFSILKAEARNITHGPELVEYTKKLDQLIIQESDQKIELEDNHKYSKSFALFDITLKDKFNLDAKKRKRMFLLEENMTGTIADLSNYVQLDVGQPSHFFKQDSVNSNKLVIEKLKHDQEFNGLGQLKNTTLPQNTEVLTDENGNLIAIPGISGAQESSVGPEDTNITLEIASFYNDKVAKNSFALNYRSSAAKLYCSDVDSYNSLIALTKLLEGLGDVEIKSKLNFISEGNVDFRTWVGYLNRPTTKLLKIDYQYLNSRLGSSDYSQKIKDALPFTGFVEGDTLRPFPVVNLTDTQEDVLREVSRVIGYDQLDQDFVNTNSSKVSSDEYYNFIRLKELVANYGFYEIATRPFVHEKKLDLIDKNKILLKLYNPYREGVETLRPDLSLTLLETLSMNVRDGFKDAKLFEIGRAYYQFETELIENNFLGLGLISDDFNLVTTLVNDVLARLGLNEYINTAEVINMGNKTSYLINGVEIASIIEVANKIKKQFDLPLNKTTILINIILPNDIHNFPAYKQYKDESQFPSIRRSYNLNVTKDLSTKSLIYEIKSIKTDFNIYIDPIERLYSEKHDKVLLNIRYTSDNRTLSTEDIQLIENTINKYETKE